MKKAIVLLKIFLPVMIVAQENGINWIQNLTWQQVKEKARQEERFIFMDVNASWCGSCKMMDKKVFLSDKVESFVNENFIAVKVQIDTSSKDDDNVKSWYGDAHGIAVEYKINALPSFLFFSSEGIIVHRDVGYKNADEFILLASNALKADRQYYTLLANYQNGKKEYESMPFLIDGLKLMKENELAKAVTIDYVQNYLSRKSEDSLLDEDNIWLIASVMKGSGDPFFGFFYRKGEKINRVMNDQKFSQKQIDKIIIKEEIEPMLWQNQHSTNYCPNWRKLYKTITGKYKKEYAERILLNTKIRWYRHINLWSEIIKYEIRKIEKYGLDTVGILNVALANNVLWDMYIHSNDKAVLKKACKWMGMIVKVQPEANYFDTYANLLYKSGRMVEGIKWQGKALSLSPNNKEYKLSLDSMKSGNKFSILK